MIRLTNKTEHATNVVYVDRIVEVPVHSEPIIEHTVTHSEHRVEVPVDRIVEVERRVEVQAPPVDLQPLISKLQELDGMIRMVANNKNEFIKHASNELGMQSRALIAIKAQRDIDRSRRLMLIRRMRKEQNTHKKTELKLKLAIGASLLLSIASLIVKL